MKAYTLFIQEPLLSAFRTASEKTGTSVSELMRTAMQEFIGRCLTLGLMTEDEVRGIYAPHDKSKTEEVTYPTFSE